MKQKILNQRFLLIEHEPRCFDEMTATYVSIPDELSEQGLQWLLNHGYSPAVDLDLEPTEVLW